MITTTRLYRPAVVSIALTQFGYSPPIKSILLAHHHHQDHRKLFSTSDYYNANNKEQHHHESYSNATETIIYSGVTLAASIFIYTIYHSSKFTLLLNNLSIYFNVYTNYRIRCVG